jgi:hypothetical protein
MYLVQIVALLRVKAGLQGQLGHADDGIHRGADFMAHIGQEVGLGAGGGLGNVACFAGVLFGDLER